MGRSFEEDGRRFHLLWIGGMAVVGFVIESGYWRSIAGSVPFQRASTSIMPFECHPY